MEWALPVDEHGFEFGIPWSCETRVEPGGAVATLTDSADPGQLRASVDISLPVGVALFSVKVTVENATARAVPVQCWTNAMLSPGAESVSGSLCFAFPGSSVVVHSTGDATLPPPKSTMPWPLVDGRDMSLLGNWRSWLGVFAVDPSAGFAGVYDSSTDLGVVRLYDPETAPGVKLFGFGAAFPDSATYTDNGSAYVELWGGPNRSFWPEDRRVLAPGEQLSWAETWMPISGIGGVSSANERAVLNLQRDPERALVGAVTAQTVEATLELLVGEGVIRSDAVVLGPGSPYRAVVPASEWQGRSGPLRLRLLERDGTLILEVAR